MWCYLEMYKNKLKTSCNIDRWSLWRLPENPQMQPIFTMLFWQIEQRCKLLETIRCWKMISSSKINNTLYCLVIIALFTFINLINLFHHSRICAFVYVLLALTANFMVELYGKKNTLLTIAICILVNAPLLSNIKYHINGTTIDGILLGSFLSIIISIFCGLSLFSSLKFSYNFHIKNFASLLLCSVIDSTIIAGFLLSKLPMDKVILIFTYDIAFKFSYSLTISFCLWLISYLLTRVKKVLLGKTYNQNHIEYL